NGHVVAATGLLPAVAEKFYSIRIFVNYRMMIVNVSVLGGGANLPPAQPNRAHWVLVLHEPGANIQMMHVLLDVEIAAKPGEIIPVPHLPLHVSLFRLPGLS